MTDHESSLRTKCKELMGESHFRKEEAARIQKALKYICQGKYTQANIVDVMDTTFTSSGKVGLVLTTDAICLRHEFVSPPCGPLVINILKPYTFIARYEDIAESTIVHGKSLWTEYSEIILLMKSGLQYKIGKGVLFINKDKLNSFINYAVSLFKVSG